ncbi:MAG: RnfABCDGE type electron transport complex subunit D [Thermodesulfobacteriota bacterium]
MNNRLIVSFSPHRQDRATIASMTYTTIAGALPAVLVGFYYYGLRAMVIVALAVLAAVATEAGLQRIMGRPVTVTDGTAVLTGLLLAMLLPPGAPWWAVIIGAMVAIFLGKQLYGGLGANPFNAVLVGWVVLRLSWPEATGQFYEPTPIWEGWGRLLAVDPSELPLGLIDYGDQASVLSMYGLWPLLVGGVPGAIGSTSVLALLLGGLYLVAKRVVPWQIPAGFLGGMLVFGLVFWLLDQGGGQYANPLYHLMFGYTLLGTFFLAPDTTTSPYTPIGMLLYGVGAGVLTLIIRFWGMYQDGVIFAILFFNALTPVLDRLRVRSYGRVKTA